MDPFFACTWNPLFFVFFIVRTTVADTDASKSASATRKKKCAPPLTRAPQVACTSALAPLRAGTHITMRTSKFRAKWSDERRVTEKETRSFTVKDGDGETHIEVQADVKQRQTRADPRDAQVQVYTRPASPVRRYESGAAMVERFDTHGSAVEVDDEGNEQRTQEIEQPAMDVHVIDRTTRYDTFLLLRALVRRVLERQHRPPTMYQWHSRVTQSLPLTSFLEVLLLEPVHLEFVKDRYISFWAAHPQMRIAWDTLDKESKFCMIILGQASCDRSHEALFQVTQRSGDDFGMRRSTRFVLDPLLHKMVEPLRMELLMDFMCITVQTGYLVMNRTGALVEISVALRHMMCKLKQQHRAMHVHYKHKRDLLQRYVDQIREFLAVVHAADGRVDRVVHEFQERGNAEVARRELEVAVSRMPFHHLLQEFM